MAATTETKKTTENQKKTLIVTVDPGFDSSKVVVQDIMFKIPAAIADITTKESIGFRKKEHMLTKVIPNKLYLMGENATEFQDDSVRYQYDYFRSTSSAAHTLTCIAYGLVKYDEYCKKNKDVEQPFKLKEITDWEIILGIALPQDVVKDFSSEQRSLLVGERNVEFQVGIEDYNVPLNLENPNHIRFASQAVSALFGILLNDSGTLNENVESKVTLVLDGGFNTMGIFLLTAANTIEDAESNTDFAMYNVYKLIAERLKEEYGQNFTKSDIDKIKKNEYFTVVLNKDGKTEKINVKETFEAVMKDVIADFMEYLNKKFNNLIHVERIVITGGTGYEYMNGITEYIKENKQHLDVNKDVILTDYEFKGKKISPEFGVAVGLYKQLKLNEKKILNS